MSQIKDHNIGIWGLSATHTALRSKSKYWLAWKKWQIGAIYLPLDCFSENRELYDSVFYMYIISTLYFNRYTGQNQIKFRKTSIVHDTYLEIQCLNVCEGRRGNARHIDTRTNRHQDISALTKTYRHWDKSAPDFRQICTFTDISALWKNLNVFSCLFMISGTTSILKS
jgi:hypothetical protein